MFTLPIKKKWFDMIIKGIKTEEYREKKHYYDTRFNTIFKNGDIVPIKYTNGYGNKVPSFVAYCSLKEGEGIKEWGAKEGEIYYILTIKKIENIKI